MSQMVPASKAGILYVNNLGLSYVGNTTFTVGIGACRDSNNVLDISIAAITTVNAAVNGLNGLDTGTFAASTWYYVLAIADSTSYNPSGCIMSLSATAPTLPAGYDSFRLIGQVLSDSSTHFLKFTQVGSGVEREYWWDSMISVLSGGASATYAAVTLTGGVPPLANTPAYFYGALTPNAAGDIASFRPTGSTATTVFTISGVVAAKAQALQFKLLSAIATSVSKVDYLVTASGALSLSVLGYVSYL